MKGSFPNFVVCSITALSAGHVRSDTWQIRPQFLFFGTIYHLGFLKEVCDVLMTIHRSILFNVGVISVQKQADNLADNYPAQ